METSSDKLIGNRRLTEQRRYLQYLSFTSLLNFMVFEYLPAIEAIFIKN